MISILSGAIWHLLFPFPGLFDRASLAMYKAVLDLVSMNRNYLCLFPLKSHLACIGTRLQKPSNCFAVHFECRWIFASLFTRHHLYTRNSIYHYSSSRY